MSATFGKRGRFVWLSLRRFVLVVGVGSYGEFRAATDFDLSRRAGEFSQIKDPGP